MTRVPGYLACPRAIAAVPEFPRLVVLLCVVIGSVAGRASAQSPIDDTVTGSNETSHWAVDSVSTFVAYRISSPLAPARIERRRFVERLSLEYVRLVGDVARRPLRIRAHASLRLDQELGRDCLDDVDRCLATGTVDATRDHQPLADVTRLELPALALSISRDARWEATVGRQLLFDDVGFLRFDGARLRAGTRFLEASAFGGRQAIHTLGSSYGFEVPGSITLSLPSGLDPSDAPRITEPRGVYVVGASVEAGEARWARGRLVFRETRDEGGLVARRLAMGLRSKPHRALSLRASAVLDPSDGTVIDASGEVAVNVPHGRATETRRASTFRLRARHFEPRFDLGSIWAYFDLVPVSQLEFRTHHRIGDLTLDAGLRGRRSEARGQGADPERDGGGIAGATYTRAGWTASVSGWFWAGSLDPVAAVLVDLRKRVGSRATVYGRASVWHFDDSFRPQVYATSLSAAVGSSVRITERTRAVAEVEYSHNRVVGPRVRGLVSLRVNAWR